MLVCPSPPKVTPPHPKSPEQTARLYFSAVTTVSFCEVQRRLLRCSDIDINGCQHAQGLRGGKPGHLFVTMKVLPHDQFRHIDDDIHLDIRLTLRQALLGAEVGSVVQLAENPQAPCQILSNQQNGQTNSDPEVQIPTLSGSATESLVITAPTQPGSSKILRSRGPPRLSGDG
eukprot:6085203-Amphidinium_carterae.1